MESSLAPPVELPARESHRPRLLLAVLAIGAAVGVAVLLANSFGHSASASRAPAENGPGGRQVGPDTPAGPATRTHAETVVTVLNGNGLTGAAAAASAHLRQIGYRIGVVGNSARADYPQSLIMYAPGFRPEAIRLGRELGVRLVGPLDGIRRGDTGRAGIVYILGTR